jgi:hypothetical protein
MTLAIGFPWVRRETDRYRVPEEVTYLKPEAPGPAISIPYYLQNNPE